MASQPDSPKNSSEIEATVVLPTKPAPAPAGARSSGGHLWHAPVALVKGTGPELVGETAALVRRRLRLAAGLMFLAFGGFLVWHALYLDPESTESIPLFVCHILLTCLLGGIAYTLWIHQETAIVWLRACEAAIFGLPMVFFVVRQYFVAIDSAVRGDFELETSPWLVLMYTYALFIPNPQRRAAVVISAMAAMPLLLMIVLLATAPAVATLITPAHLTGLPLIMLLAAVGSVLGVDTIGTLRREVFEFRQLGQYRLKKRLGAGGMGEVYLAEHQLLKRPCVVKLIQPSKAGDPAVLARFQREVRATAQLSHWNTVEIFDYGSTPDGTFYYVMEYLPGMSLEELVERFGPMPPDRAIYLLEQTCDALREAHSVGLIHRDIKPGNIFVAQRGGVYDVAKLLDFGLVKPLLGDLSGHLTAEGTIAGTPLFMSPEQALGEANPDGRSDIYSLGAVAYYVLSGHPPFERDTPMQVLIAHAREELVPPSKHCGDLPADLEQVVLQCMAKSPADRYQTATSLAQALGECRAAGCWTRERAAQWWQETGQVATG